MTFFELLVGEEFSLTSSVLMNFCSEGEKCICPATGMLLERTFITALMVASDKYTLGMVGCRKCRNSDTLGVVAASLSLFLRGLT